MLTDHDVTEELAAAFHDQADPVTRTALDPAGIFPRGARARRRRAAIRAAGAGTTATALAVAVIVANLGAGPAPGPGAAPRPPGLLLDAAVAGPPPAGAAVSGMPPYYVTADHFRPVAEVRDSVTGKVLSHGRAAAHGSTRRRPRSRRPVTAARSSSRCRRSRRPGSTGCGSPTAAIRPG